MPTFTNMHHQVNMQDGIIRLESETSFCDIWPGQGGILNRWQAECGGKRYELIEGYADFEDFRRHAEAKGFRSCKLSPYVCRTSGSTYVFEGKTYTIGKFMLAGASLHGLIYDVPFEVTAHSAHPQQGASLSLLHRYTGSDAGYPFPFDITVDYRLQGNRLDITTTVQNRSSQTIPVADGWHPYFRLSEGINQLELTIRSGRQLELNEKLVPSGREQTDRRFKSGGILGTTELDHCFILEGDDQAPAAILHSPEEKTAITIYALEHYPYLQLYTPPDRKSIAIENLSAAPDAFNNGIGLHYLSPGGSQRFRNAYSFGPADEQA